MTVKELIGYLSKCDPNAKIQSTIACFDCDDVFYADDDIVSIAYNKKENTVTLFNY